MKEAEKLRATAMEKYLKELLYQSERAVLVSKNTDKLSTEAPSDEEYLKLF